MADFIPERLTYLILLHTYSYCCVLFPNKVKSSFLFMTPVNIQFVCISDTKFTRAVVLYMEKPLFVHLYANIYSAAMIYLGTKIMLVWQ